LFKIKSLTVEDTTFYKGIAILMILFHNFFHWVKPSPGENEIVFDNQIVINYINIIKSDYFEFFQATFSFLGHYGVQVFIFLSAYGLTKKYISKNINYLDFIKKRISKVYFPFIFAIIIWFLYLSLFSFTWGNSLGPIEIISKNLTSLIYKITLISNFVPDEVYSINGPWWFISLIIQFYFVFPFLLKISQHEKGNTFLLMIAGMSIFISMLLNGKLPFFIYGTFIGHLPEFILGIYLAKKENFSISLVSFIGVLIIFILGNIYTPLWYFTDISITLILILILQNLKKITTGTVLKFINYIGGISMFIFLLNGFLRKPFINIANEIGLWYATITISLVFFLFVIFISHFSDKIYNKIIGK